MLKAKASNADAAPAASAQSAVAPTASVAVSAKISKAVKAVLSCEGKLEEARDTLCRVCLSETTEHGWTAKQLTALLLVEHCDPARVSEIVKIVFPAHSAARVELDKALEINANATQPKERIAKPVIMALARDKTGTLTLEAAKAAHVPQRSPGGKTNQTAPAAPANAAPVPLNPDGSKKSKKQLQDEMDAHLGNLIAAALNFAKANGYDRADYEAVHEEWADKILPEAEPEAE